MPEGIPRYESYRVKNRSKVKGNGQECPFHTGKINTNVKSYAVGFRSSHPSASSGQAFPQRTREMGRPVRLGVQEVTNFTFTSGRSSRLGGASCLF